MTPLDEARMYQRQLDATGLTQRALFHRLGVHPGRMSGRLALLDLDDEVMAALDRGEIGVTRAKATLPGRTYPNPAWSGGAA